MNNIQLSKYFFFNEFSFKKYKHTDMSRGSGLHYVGRMLEGNARIKSDKNEIVISEGDTFYIPLGCKYHSYWFGDDEIKFLSLGFSAFPGNAGEKYALQLISATENDIELMRKIKTGQSAHCDDVGNFLLLFASLKSRMTPEKTRSKRSELVMQALDVMKKHPEYDVPTLAKQVCVSESGLYGMFRKELGETPITVKNKILAERAEFLLQTTDMSVEEVSERLGFSSSGYFRKVIRSVTGKSPRELRGDRMI